MLAHRQTFMQVVFLLKKSIAFGLAALLVLRGQGKERSGLNLKLIAPAVSDLNETDEVQNQV